MVEPDRRRFGQRCGDGGGGGGAYEHLHGREAPPIAEVLDEGAVAGGTCPLGSWRQVGKVGVDGLGGECEQLGVERLADAHCTIALEVAVDLPVVDHLLTLPIDGIGKRLPE
ncbi:MAG: hypothetical protein R2710_23165 [Acidimicrobiales bacterium]